MTRPIFIPMITALCPKLPMRDKASTSTYYVEQLGFRLAGDHGNGQVVHFESPIAL